MFYYLLVILAVIMFGAQFFFNGIYSRENGSSIRSSFTFTFFTNIIGATVLFMFSGFSLKVTPFTALIALLRSANSILFSYFAIKSLGIINLSLFSVFSMIGGMTLPFVAGIVAFNEKLTFAKIICFAFIALAMVFTVDRNGKKGGWLYYLGVFITNGMSGVLSMIFNNLDFPKSSAADLSVLSAMFSIAISGITLLFLLRAQKHRGKIPFSKKTVLSLAMCGTLSIIANYILLIALKHVPGSMQYPLVTGGVMIVSTLIGFFTSKKPTKKHVLSVGISFVGILALLLPF